ncbi:hypothetical protein [Oxynema aestuarii]|uniref:Uncharacterized protein n=1 Tax=Oxynema aestuarii AP17 TaxID=2064643 RepID=A0A6H1TUW3_9CYAN|nr:hypothetical protein [Oxynema aestuarii]QIZ69937.1 hypothetical protein HCG48_04540 [Oxynema aestuarii AP17]
MTHGNSTHKGTEHCDLYDPLPDCLQESRPGGDRPQIAGDRLSHRWGWVGENAESCS